MMDGWSKVFWSALLLWVAGSLLILAMMLVAGFAVSVLFGDVDAMGWFMEMAPEHVRGWFGVCVGFVLGRNWDEFKK